MLHADDDTCAEVRSGLSSFSITASGKQVGSFGWLPKIASAPKHQATLLAASDLPNALSAEMTCKPPLNSSFPSNAPTLDSPKRDLAKPDHDPSSMRFVILTFVNAVNISRSELKRSPLRANADSSVNISDR